MRNKTPQDINWYFFSAEGKVLGELATEVSKTLLGKNKATFTRGVLNRDKVVVTDASKVVVTGKKEEKKLYRRHSNFPGGLKTETLSQVRAKDPRRLVREAVWGMLPTSYQRKRIIANLYIYPNAEHPHKAQEGKA